MYTWTEPKNIDKTIQVLLYTYANHCAGILQKECKKLQRQKFASMQDRTDAIQKYTEKRNALKLLYKIAEKPKGFLYTGRDMIYTEMTNHKSLYLNLLPILGMRFDPTGNNVLVRLSEVIAHHVQFGQQHNTKEGDWIYYNNSGMRDFEAEKIINMNFALNRAVSNDFVAAFKSMFMPAQCYAVDFYQKEK